MIYIFSGCQSICSLPGTLCAACGDACKSCPGVCKGIGSLFSGCGNTIKHFMERPLCVYVLFSWCVSGFAIFSAYSDMIKKTPGEGDAPAGACTSTYLLILQAFAAINIAFAVYVQCAVWKTIMRPENREQFIDGDVPAQTMTGSAGGAAAGLLGQAAAKAGGGGVGAALGRVAGAAAKPATEQFPPNPGKVIIPTQVVQDAFKTVFMEDLLVLAMFIGLLAMFCLSWSPSILDSGANVCEKSDATKDCGLAFFCIGALWSFMYMKCSCCANKVSLTKEEYASYDEGYNKVDAAGNAA